MFIQKGQRLICRVVPSYGKWYVGGSYKVAKVTETEVLIRDAKNERKNFSLDSNNFYYVFNFFSI